MAFVNPNGLFPGLDEVVVGTEKVAIVRVSSTPPPSFDDLPQAEWPVLDDLTSEQWTWSLEALRTNIPT